jgi:lipopolysaccharide biosynthesis glycosyltransferase
MSKNIRVFIGYDSNMPVAFSVLSHSIHVRASLPVSIMPIMLSQLQGVFARERDPLQSTEFSFTRFLTPYLCNFEGWSIFMDNDILVLDDIAKLWALRDERYAVQVVKHIHVPKEDIKFLDQPQTKYEKKNWSSVILFNNARCKVLTPEFINTTTGLMLHQFKWLADESLIGELPHKWNHLVDYDPPNPEVSLVHYTLGGPFYNEFMECEYAEEWFAEREQMGYCAQREKIK